MNKMILAIALLISSALADITTDNVCTFHKKDKLFTLISVEKVEPYYYAIDEKTIQWNFCSPFKPKQCENDPNLAEGFSFLVERQEYEQQQQNDGNETEQIVEVAVIKERIVCTPYSSDSTISLYETKYIKQRTEARLVLTQYDKDPKVNKDHKETVITIYCSQDITFNLISVEHTDTAIFIQGRSRSGCPVFAISSLWYALQQNKVLFGILLFILGLKSMFFGRVMLVITIFIATYFMSFIVIGGLFTILLRPDTSSILVYFSLILILFACTLLAYGATKLVKVSIFCIGAWLGFIMGALVNSIFAKIFQVYSIWSLVAFQVFFMLPCGMLTFRYADIIVIVSTSLTGAYLVVRPISWIFGGFPNEFLLEELIESGELNSLPWSFFLYLVMIIALAILGGLYQFLKLRREDPNQQIEVNFVEAQVEESVDKVKEVVETFIERYKSDSQSEEYKKMNEMQNRSNHVQMNEGEMKNQVQMKQRSPRNLID